MNDARRAIEEMMRILADFEHIKRDNNQLMIQVTSLQERCNELLEETRELKRILAECGM